VLIDDAVDSVADSCDGDHFIVGDGTIVGCKNLIYLYGKELAVETFQEIFSSSNCAELGYCSSNAALKKPLPLYNKENRNSFINQAVSMIRRRILKTNS
jgi:hypothetical protein